MKRHSRTDLAAELDLSGEGISRLAESRLGIRAEDIEIHSDAAAKRLGKPKGRYITIEVGRLWLESDERFAAAEAVLSDKLSSLADELCSHPPASVMVVGLGNRRITADALGDSTVGLLTVTRHIRTDERLKHDERLRVLLGGCELSALVPGVVGQTGIETAELVRGACEHVKPELVLAVDSLCARSTERLATTVQLASSGLSPGSGIGNRRLAINKDTLGVPVIALGIPTVVDSSTLVEDALERAGIAEMPDSLADVLNNRRGFFVTPKETDTIISELSRLCAGAITEAFMS